MVYYKCIYLWLVFVSFIQLNTINFIETKIKKKKCIYLHMNFYICLYECHSTLKRMSGRIIGWRRQKKKKNHGQSIKVHWMNECWTLFIEMLSDSRVKLRSNIYTWLIFDWQSREHWKWKLVHIQNQREPKKKKSNILTSQFVWYLFFFFMHFDCILVSNCSLHWSKCSNLNGYSVYCLSFKRLSNKFVFYK